MVEHKIHIASAALVCLAALRLAPVAASRAEPQEPPEMKAGAKKSEQKKSAEPKPETPTIRIQVEAEGMTELPEQSSIELRGDNLACKGLERKKPLDRAGKVTFSELPACPVLLKIFITGFETKVAKLDLAGHRNPDIRIRMQSDGPPTVE